MPDIPAPDGERLIDRLDSEGLPLAARISAAPETSSLVSVSGDDPPFARSLTDILPARPLLGSDGFMLIIDGLPSEAPSAHAAVAAAQPDGLAAALDLQGLAPEHTALGRRRRRRQPADSQRQRPVPAGRRGCRRGAARHLRRGAPRPRVRSAVCPAYQRRPQEGVGGLGSQLSAVGRVGRGRWRRARGSSGRGGSDDPRLLVRRVRL